MSIIFKNGNFGNPVSFNAVSGSLYVYYGVQAGIVTLIRVKLVEIDRMKCGQLLNLVQYVEGCLNVKGILIEQLFKRVMNKLFR